MSKLINLTGKIFNRWTVVGPAPKKKNQMQWYCICICGKTSSVSGWSLRIGTSQSCGCLKLELNDALKLDPKQKLINKHKMDALRDAQPERKEDKRLNQKRYLLTTKAILSYFHRWAKKKNKNMLTDAQVLALRDQPCHRCGNPILGVGIGFTVVCPRQPITIDNVLSTCGVCKHIKPKESFDPIKFSRGLLRRFWKRTPMVALARQKSRKGRGQYECAECKNLFKEKETQIDHIDPVINPIEGFINLDIFARRLFCDDSNLNVLCKQCHLKKTAAEHKVRQQQKKIDKLE